MIHNTVIKYFFWGMVAIGCCGIVHADDVVESLVQNQEIQQLQEQQALIDVQQIQPEEQQIQVAEQPVAVLEEHVQINEPQIESIEQIINNDQPSFEQAVQPEEQHIQVLEPQVVVQEEYVQVVEPQIIEVVEQLVVNDEHPSVEQLVQPEEQQIVVQEPQVIVQEEHVQVIEPQIIEVVEQLVVNDEQPSVEQLVQPEEQHVQVQEQQIVVQHEPEINEQAVLIDQLISDSHVSEQDIQLEVQQILVQEEPAQIQENLEVITLPKFSKKDIQNCSLINYSHKNPEFILNVKNYGKKMIVQNYGHGSDALALSWGCAQEAADQMWAELKRLKRQRTKKVAVIGSGVIALTTAYELLSQGYRVTLYTSENLSQVIEKAGHFGDLQVVAETLFNATEQRKKMAATSWERFNKSIRLMSGLYVADEYCNDNNCSGKNVIVSFPDNQQKQMTQRNAMIVDCAAYLQSLFKKVKEMKLVIKQRTFKNLDEVLKLPQGVIHNCCDLVAKKIFNDHNVVESSKVLINLKSADANNSFVVNQILSQLPHGYTTGYVQLPGRSVLQVGLPSDAQPKSCDEIIEMVLHSMSLN